jgi:hypothetical protein
MNLRIMYTEEGEGARYRATWPPDRCPDKPQPTT